MNTTPIVEPDAGLADYAIINARLLTCAGPMFRRGAEMNDLGIISSAHVAISAGRITSISQGTPPRAAHVIDARGRVVMPGLVDCHTHACWAGNRLGEWEERLNGVAYLDILARGGGIMSTVRSVRDATQTELENQLVTRLERAQLNGTTSIEVKSGYGLSLEAELKMLRAIAAVGRRMQMQVIPTALLGHAIDSSQADFVEQTISATLPAVRREFPGITVDAFCEKGAWSFEETRALFAAAQAGGHPCRVHADQFNDLGVIAAATSLHLRSVDHLEASTPESLQLLASTWGSGARGVVGVGLPLCGLHMADGRFANLKALVANGGVCAIATNCNPGSAPSISMPLAIAIAVRYCGLTPQQAIIASTVNPASVLGLSDTGRIEVGCRADLIMLQYTDERALAYELGGDHIKTVIANGRVQFNIEFEA
ncbi:MAG: imidazolonepropionase [Planctomycetota bacterium]|nr:imidazolonepropionase [Planctomycetota bacterium]